MGLFGKDKTKTAAELQKEFLEKKKELELAQETEKKKEQLNALEEMEDFEVEATEESSDDLKTSISKYIEENGVEPTINYIDQIKNQLMVEFMIQNLSSKAETTEPETKENDEERLQLDE